MAIKIGNKVYRNIQEQVAKNQEDIADLEERIPSVPYGVLELDLEGGSGILTDEQYNLIADRRTVFIRPNTSNAEDIYFKCKEDDTYYYFVTYVSKYTYTQQGKTSLYQEDFFVSKEDKSWGYSNMFSTQFYDETQANNKFQNKLYDYNISITKDFTLAQWTDMGGDTSDFPADATAVEVRASFNGLSSQNLTITNLLQLATGAIHLDNIWGSIWPHDENYDSDVDEAYFSASLELLKSLDPVTSQVNKIGIFPCHAGIQQILFDEGTYTINVSKTTI